MSGRVMGPPLNDIGIYVVLHVFCVQRSINILREMWCTTSKTESTEAAHTTTRTSHTHTNQKTKSMRRSRAPKKRKTTDTLQAQTVSGCCTVDRVQWITYAE